MPLGAESGQQDLARAVREAGERLCRLYALELSAPLERFVVAPEEAREHLPPRAPRTGLLVVEEEDSAWVGLYVDPRDQTDPGAILEETSHLVCLLWHASQGRPISCLALELQAEVDRYALARLRGGDALAHFRHFRFAPSLAPPERARYEAAHRGALRYCGALQRRFPRRADRAGLLRELRRFYRSTPHAKLRWVHASRERACG